MKTTASGSCHPTHFPFPPNELGKAFGWNVPNASVSLYMPWNSKRPCKLKPDNKRAYPASTDPASIILQGLERTAGLLLRHHSFFFTSIPQPGCHAGLTGPSAPAWGCESPWMHHQGCFTVIRHPSHTVESPVSFPWVLFAQLMSLWVTVRGLFLSQLMIL